MRDTRRMRAHVAAVSIAVVIVAFVACKRAPRVEPPAAVDTEEALIAALQLMSGQEEFTDDGSDQSAVHGHSLGVTSEQLRVRWNAAIKKRGLDDAAIDKISLAPLLPGGTAYTEAKLVKARLEMAIESNHDGTARAIVVVANPESRAETAMAGKLILSALDAAAGSALDLSEHRRVLAKLGLIGVAPPKRAVVATKGIEVGLSRSLGGGVIVVVRAPAVLPTASDRNVSLVVPAGSIPGFGRIGQFSMQRLAGDGGRSFVEAAQACHDAGLTLCTDAQWHRACGVAKTLASGARTWTMTAVEGAYDNARVRGGASCEDGEEVPASQKNAARDGLCCARSLSVSGAKDALGWMRALPVLDYENAVNARDREAMSAALEETIEQFYLQVNVARDDAIKMGMSYMSTHKSMWSTSGECEIGEVAGDIAIDCVKLVVEGQKFMWVKSRYFPSDKNPTRLSSILDLKVLRGLRP